ncbi:MAG TPA: flagellar hook protein, partial [Desulfobacterales bacterium]|nr:flagellar hook protein [Desulfobacterales bacterium]
MALATQMISGLASGLDWRDIIDQLMRIERRPIDLVENKKSEYEQRLSAWQDLNTRLLSLRSAVDELKDPEDFNLFKATMTSSNTTVTASTLLNATTSSSAAPGTYTITISNLASAQKLSSNPFASITEALGTSYAGDILINGRVIHIYENDSLADIRDRINAANTGSNPTGVTASIVSYGTNNYRLILTNDTTGEEGISLLNASSADLLQLFGWKDS